MQVVKLIFSPKLGLPLLGLIAWLVCFVSILHHYNLWSSDLISSTILWFIFVGMVWFVKIADAGKDPTFIRGRLIEAIGIGAFFEFFLNLEVLPLVGELILQSVVILLVMLNVVAGLDEKNKPAQKLIMGMLTLISLGLIAYTIRHLVDDWSSLDAGLVLEQLLLPVLLTIAAVPIIYCIALYAGYEQLFLRLSFLNDRRRPSTRALIGIALSLKGSLRAVNNFRGDRAREVAQSSSTISAYHAGQAFKTPGD